MVGKHLSFTVSYIIIILSYHMDLHALKYWNLWQLVSFLDQVQKSPPSPQWRLCIALNLPHGLETPGMANGELKQLLYHNIMYIPMCIYIYYITYIYISPIYIYPCWIIVDWITAVGN